MGGEGGPVLVAVFGFLGSGKTTVLMNLARAAVAGGRRVAVVVNEAGEIPVDGKVFEVGGLTVREIFGGCICCSVVGDFVETLRTLQQVPDLDTIFIEPSGMADAPRLFASLEKHARSRLTRVLVLDGPRLPLLLKAAGPLIRNQLRAADLVLWNKSDAAPYGADAARLLLAEGLPDGVAVVEVCARRGLPDDVLKKAG